MTVEWSNARIAALLGAVAFLLYVPLIGWGVPHATAPDRTKPLAIDDILPLDTLAEMHNTFIVSKPDRHYGYPWFQYFVASAAEAPYLIYEYLTGDWKSPTPAFPFGFKDPARALRMLTIFGRLATVLMACGTVIAAFYFSTILWGRSAGVIAAVLTMLNYLMVYYARTGNLDVPAFFWISLAMVVFARVLTEGLTKRRAVWLGLLAGLAMATKDQAVVFVLPLGLVLLWPRFHGPGPYPTKAALTGLGVFLLAYAAGTAMLFDPHRHITHLAQTMFSQTVGMMGYFWPKHPRTLEGFAALAGDYGVALMDTCSLPVLLAACYGIFLAARSAPRKLILLLPVVTLFVIVVMPMGYMVRRYILPLTLMLDAFAAFAVVSLWRSVPRAVSVAMFTVLIGFRALIAADLSYSQDHETRYNATAWLDQHTRPGDRIEYFGAQNTLPHFRADVSTAPVIVLATWPDPTATDARLTEMVKTRWSKTPPEFVIVIPDWTSTPDMERSADCPPEIFRELMDGTADYGLAEYVPARGLFSGVLARPRLDSQSVSPPVRIFERKDLEATRNGH